MCLKVSNKLSVTSWNVNGLFKRMSGSRICKLDDDNVKSVMTSDSVALSETHASNEDMLTYDGFKCYVNCRKTKSNRARGGIATFIKKDIVPGVKILDTAMDDMMWLRL